MRAGKFVTLCGMFAALLVGSLTIPLTLVVPTALAACPALPSDKGYVTNTISVPAAGTYRVWSRIYSPSAGNDGFYMQIDQNTCNVAVGNGGAIATGGLTWVDWLNGNQNTKFNVSLTAGIHTVVAAGLDPGVGIDKVIFLSDTSCSPIGDGSNCSATASTVSTPSPTTAVLVGGLSGTNPSVSGTISLTPANSVPGSTATYLVDSKPIAGNQIDTTKLSDGKHTVEIVQTTPDGKKVIQTKIINVANGWLHILGDSLNAHPALYLVGLLVLAGVLWGVWQRRHRMPPLDGQGGGHGGNVDVATAIPIPQSGLIMPDSSEVKLVNFKGSYVALDSV